MRSSKAASQSSSAVSSSSMKASQRPAAASTARLRASATFCTGSSKRRSGPGPLQVSTAARDASQGALSTTSTSTLRPGGSFWRARLASRRTSPAGRVAAMQIETSGRIDRLLSEGAAPREHGAGGAQQDRRVERERPVADVVEVVLEVLVHRQVLAPEDLPESGDPWLHREAPPLPLVVAGDDERHLRSRADERHLAAQHVPQLRQLVEAGRAQPAPGGGDARVATRGRRWRLGVGVAGHCAELPHAETPAVAADALLREERRAGAPAADAPGAPEQERRQRDQRGEGHAEVEGALADLVERVRALAPEAHQRQVVDEVELRAGGEHLEEV